MSETIKIAQNTIVLYFRMLFTTAVSLYISRVILDILGIVDYGVYNVVAGFVVMFGFLNSAMAASTQRYLTFELGKANYIKLKQVFNLSVSLHILIALIILILSETLGIWFLNNKLNIPDERLNTANWVFQFSVFTGITTILGVPYNAAIIAHEQIKIFAYISMAEVMLKLGIAFLLKSFGNDKLFFYALYLFLISSLITVLYKVYCTRNFKECNYKFFWERKLFLEMTSFAGWNLLGVFAGIGYTQGVNILLNMFFGPVVNAARGIAFQIMGAINQLVTNFQMAFNPPLTKSYAENGKNTYKLVFASSKFSYCLLLLFIVPMIIETKLILSVWLKEVPQYTIGFTRLVLIDIAIGSLSGPLQILAQATGKVKKYQLIVSIILLLNLPASYILIKLGYSPESTFIISILLSTVALFARLWVLRTLIKFPVKEFLKKVVLVIILVTLITLFIPVYTRNFIQNDVLQFLWISFSTGISLITAIWFVGLSNSDRTMFKVFVKKKFNYI